MLGGDGATTSEGVAAVPAEHMATRAEKKARTRNALMDSVLHIVGVGANFASISLREVAKTAGVVPTLASCFTSERSELAPSPSTAPLPCMLDWPARM